MKLRTMLLLVLVLGAPWIYNCYKFTQCDFKSDYKCEVIHSVGVFIPPSAYVTVWFDHDSEEETTETN